MNILLLSAGRRVELYEILKNELSQISQKSILFTADANIKNSAVCLLNPKYSVEIPKVLSKDYIKFLKNYCINKQIKIVIPTIDTELEILASSRDEFEDMGINIIISDKKIINLCRNKKLQEELFSIFDIKTPRLFSREKIVYPAFAKPTKGSRSQDLYVLNSPSDFTQSMDEKDLLFMEFVDPSKYDEYTVDMYFSIKGDLKSLVPRKRIAVRDGEVSIGKTEKKKLYELLVKKFIRLPGARGCLTCQFFYSKKGGDLKGIEINPRFGGGYPLSYTAGANFPRLIFQEYLFDQEVDFCSSWKDDLKMVRYDSSVFIEET